MNNEEQKFLENFLSQYKYRIEMHAHSYPASPCSDFSPAELAAVCKEAGYHGVVLTNHFFSDGWYMGEKDPAAAYLDDYYKLLEEGRKTGLKIYLGAEYRFTQNGCDYLVYGADEQLLRDTAGRLDMGIDEFYREFASPGRLIFQAHPFRADMKLADPASLDGIEVFNVHPNHNSRVGLAGLYAKEHFELVGVGTDLHHPGHQGVCALRAKFLPEDDKALVAMLRSKDYIFEVGGFPVLPYTGFKE